MRSSAAPATRYESIEEWVAGESIPFEPDDPASLSSAVDRMMAVIADCVHLLGIGEPMHGAEDFLLLRNRLFQRLVEAHGFSAIAIESSYPRGFVVNDYVAGRGAATSYGDVKDAGFSHGFGPSPANRELVEWMRRYNADPSRAVKLQFYGFDSPTEMMSTDSPRKLLRVALDFLALVDGAAVDSRRRRIEELLGDDAAWENPGAAMDPSKSVGLTAAAASLRIDTEDLISQLGIRRPELIAKTDLTRYLDAMQHAVVARQILNYHAALATPSEDRIARLLGIRDLVMADNLANLVERERGRGRVLAFAHNSHLKRGVMRWQLGPHALAWWPAGAHAHHTLGGRYAVIGVGVGTSESQGVAAPEPGTLEALLTAGAGASALIPTHRDDVLPASATAALPTRAVGGNPSYFPFSAASLTDFDWLAVLSTVK
jgi:erythromycin esterase-like protein